MRDKTIRLLPADVRQIIAADQRRPISTGYFNGKHPVSLPHFYLAEYPELAAVYSDKPESLVVMFPANDLREIMIAENNFYLKSKSTGKGVKFRYCDGETCAFNCSMNIKGKNYMAGDVAPCVCDALNLEGDDRCKSYFHFKAWIVNPKTSLIISHITYRFETRSPNTRNNILSEIKNVQHLTSPDGIAIAEDNFITSGKLIGIYFMLSVKMIDQPGKQKRRFPIWNLRAIGDKNMLLQCAERAQLPITKAVLQLSAGDLKTAEDKLLAAKYIEHEEELHETPMEDQASALPLFIDAGLHQSPTRAQLERTFKKHMENRAAVGVDQIIGRVWNDDLASLTEEEMRVCIKQWESKKPSEREDLEHKFADYMQDRKPNDVMLVIKRNWDKDWASLTNDELRLCIAKWSSGNGK